MDIDEQYDKIYRFCYLRVRHRETAEDITQETFLRFLEHPQYHNTDKTLQLLYTIAGNLCTDEFRKKTSASLSDTDASPDDVEDSVLSSYSLQQALQQLAETSALLLFAHFLLTFLYKMAF